MTPRIITSSLVALVGATLPLVATTPTATAADQAPVQQLHTPQVIGHRGAPGYRPEHTLAGYQLAIDQGADYIEPDLVSTKDGVLVARHENNITGTTDVADHPEFADLKTTKTIDGQQVTGWFTEDFTFKQLETLRAKERLPQVRPDNTKYDGMYKIPSFAQVLRLVQENDRRTGREIGVAPETKHPTYFDSIGLSPEEPMVKTLEKFGYDSPKDKVLIQSFEISNLQQLDHMTDLPLEQLIDSSGAPYDKVAAGDSTTYRDMTTPEGLKKISQYADWAGPSKDLVLPRDPNTGATTVPSDLVEDAHHAGLRVVIWTLREENQFMATNYRRGTDPNAHGDMAAEIHDFLDAGVDALFSDFPDDAVDARDSWVAEHPA